MFDTPPIRTNDMPAEMRTLLADYPRDDWEAHPGFKEKTRHWLGAHQMFRQLCQITRTETERYLDKSRAAHDFADRLSHYGDALVRSLHGHHGWEDHIYFPELSAADPRFNAGLEILEKDHEALDRVLDGFTKTGNRVIKLIQLDEKQAWDEAGILHGMTGTIEAFLNRHLSDEEELAVPIILHHRLRG
jgi:iron-sulfur cluster repair protein YtfE (RIC family)